MVTPWNSDRNSQYAQFISGSLKYSSQHEAAGLSISKLTTTRSGQQHVTILIVCLASYMCFWLKRFSLLCLSRCYTRFVCSIDYYDLHTRTVIRVRDFCFILPLCSWIAEQKGRSFRLTEGHCFVAGSRVGDLARRPRCSAALQLVPARAAAGRPMQRDSSRVNSKHSVACYNTL